jgi:hypothetical protein
MFSGHILRIFGMFCCHVVKLSGFGILQREKSGNPVHDNEPFHCQFVQEFFD